MLANILVLKGDMIGPIGMPVYATAARMKVLARHEEFRDPHDGLADPPRFIRCQLGHAKAVTLGVITTKNPRERDAVGIPHDVTL